MAYTFFHAGVLIGESNLEESSGKRRQRSGVFRPTPYGLALFPRLSGILSAGEALRAHLDERGLDPDTLAAEQVEELLSDTPFGQKIIDIGRMLSEVEVRASGGQRMEFASIAFNDIEESRRVLGLLDLRDSNGMIAGVPAGPRYFVSLTFGKDPNRRRRPVGARSEWAS